MFELEKANYELSPIKFACDDNLTDHIMPPFPNKSFFMLICGKPASGKTTFMLNMLISKGDNRIYRKVFDKICLVMPTNSRRSIKNDPFDDLPADQMFDEMNSSVIEKIKSIRDDFTELDKKKKRNRNQLLILDDVTAYLKDKDNMRSLIELATNRRHLKLSIILLVQFVRAVPRPVRFQITDVVFFKPSNSLDIAIIGEEFVNMKKDDFQALTRFVYDDSHDYLYVDKNNELYYKNLQHIILPKNDLAL